MKLTAILTYLANSFLLLIPILVWNLIFLSALPSALAPASFWKDIPPFVAYGENILRMVTVVLPFLMPIRLVTRSQKTGLGLYIVGTLIYFSSWLLLIYSPQSRWSLSVWGFLAPAVTPLIWLTGIGLIGDSLYVRVPYRSWAYILLSVLFVAFHSVHTLMIYGRVI